MTPHFSKRPCSTKLQRTSFQSKNSTHWRLEGTPFKIHKHFTFFYFSTFFCPSLRTQHSLQDNLLAALIFESTLGLEAQTLTQSTHLQGTTTCLFPFLQKMKHTSAKISQNAPRVKLLTSIYPLVLCHLLYISLVHNITVFSLVFGIPPIFYQARLAILKII